MRRWVPAAAVVMILAAACTPAGGTPTTTLPPGPPVITLFGPAPGAGSGPAPALLTLRWSVVDPQGLPVTCRFDTNGDGVLDVIVTNCQQPGSRNVSLAAAGTYTPTMQADDGSYPVVSASSTLTVTASSSTQPFTVSIQPVAPLSTAVQAAFDAAAARWTAIITRAVPDVTVNLAAGFCLNGAPALSGNVHNLVIQVAVAPIDGAGGILGQAGPCVVSAADQLTRVGDMQFDSADVSNLLNAGAFGDVVLHEMGHILGVGTLWDSGRSLLSGAVAAGGTDPRFTGPRGVAEYSKLGGTTAVPVENSGGDGTVDAHWRETTFGTELMTGYIGGPPNPLSALTIASLADLGYQVDLSQADAYALPGPPALRTSPAVVTPPMALHGPKASS